jgi:hypothetical protein
MQRHPYKIRITCSTFQAPSKKVSFQNDSSQALAQKKARELGRAAGFLLRS